VLVQKGDRIRVKKRELMRVSASKDNS